MKDGMERMACPECGTMNPMIGVVNATRQYVCRRCGMVYYTPDECLSEDKNKPEPDGEDGEKKDPKGEDSSK